VAADALGRAGAVAACQAVLGSRYTAHFKPQARISLQEAAAAADALGRAGAFAACQAVLGSIPVAFALSLRASLPAPLQLLAPPTPGVVQFLSR